MNARESVASEAGGEAAAPLELVLYVAPNSPSCVKAKANLDAALAAYDPARVRLTVRDVSQSVEEAERDRIVFTPTLLVRGAEAGCVVGDLTQVDAVEALLTMGGLEKTR